MTDRYRYRYYLGIKITKMLPFVKTCQDLKGIKQHKIRQRKTNTAWFHLHVKSNRAELIKA